MSFAPSPDRFVPSGASGAKSGADQVTEHLVVRLRDENAALRFGNEVLVQKV